MKIQAVLSAAVMGLPLLLLQPASAQEFRHPDYRHAVVELRDAHWLLERRVGGPLSDMERHALGEIDRALEDVERSARIDREFRWERPREEEYPGPARLRRVSELLRAARNDVAQQEDFTPAREAQYRAIRHIDDAIRTTEEVMVERERMHDYERYERDYDRR